MANDTELPTWIFIQINTFTNWLNHELASTDLRIEDLREDLRSGTTLVRIVEQLQKRVCTGKLYINDPNEIQCLMNVQMALEALEEDNIKLVNIGAEDIVSGNLKQTLGLIFCLIQRYQLPQYSKIPAKKLLMAFLQSVLPVRLTNFRQNWNDGIALAALVDYCSDSEELINWQDLDPAQKCHNCERALEFAERVLGVPAILTPEDLSSPDLDELSTITYLSYFIKPDGPAYKTLISNIQNLINDVQIADFGQAWNDGYLLCRLVQAVGGTVSSFDEMTFDDQNHWLWNVRTGLDAAIDLGVEANSLVSAEEIAELNTDALSLIALCAALSSLKPDYDETEEQPNVFVRTSCLQNQQLNLDLTFADQTSISTDQLDIFVTGPKNQIIPNEDLLLSKQRTDKGVVLSLVPKKVGTYTIQILCDGVELLSPIQVEVKRNASVESPSIIDEDSGNQTAEMSVPDYYDPPSSVGHVSFSGLSEPCSIGSVVEVVINAQGGKAPGDVRVLSISPSKRERPCEVIHQANHFTAIFTPDETGEWHVVILYDGQHIRGSPFACQVFDADKVSVYGLDVGLIGQELNFTVDASRAGQGQCKASIYRNSHQIPCGIVEEKANGRYKVRFTPDGAGQYSIVVKFNNIEIKGSPFVMDLADASSVSVHGDQLKIAAVNKPAIFFVHAPGAELKDLNIIITDPDDRVRHARIVPGENSSFSVEWLPVSVGEHQIDIRLYHQTAYETPFICNVGDPELVSVRNIPKYIDPEQLHKDLSFEIDAQKAGSGNLEIVINQGSVTCRVREMATRQFLAQFTPVQPIAHQIELKFNNEHIRGSPWTVPLRSSSDYQNGDTHYTTQQQITTTMSASDEDRYVELAGIGLRRAQVGKISFFDITTTSGEINPSDVSIRLIDPNGKSVDTNLFALRNSLRCEYTIHQVGDYSLEAYMNGRLIASGQLSGYDLSKVHVHPVKVSGVNNPAQFTVSASEAGKGQLEISVNQGQVPNNVQMQDAGRCLVTFIPQKAGTYTIDVSFNGMQVHGCPIRVDVTSNQVGKPVVHQQRFPAGAVVAGSVSPRPPSSAYFSAGSPQVDTSMHSPASAFQTMESPRSPSLVAAAHTRHRSSDQEDKPRNLRSPRLVQETSTRDPGNLGYTVAHYDDRGPAQQSTTITTHRYFGDSDDIRARPGDSTVDSGLGSYSATSPRPHRYFESESTTHNQHEWRKPLHHQEHAIGSAPPLPKSSPPADDSTFEMTRSAEVKLYHDNQGSLRPASIKTQDLTSYGGPVEAGSDRIQEQGYDYRVTSDSTAPQLRQIEASRRIGEQVSPKPLGDIPPRDYEEPPVDELSKTKELHSVPIESAVFQKPAYEEQQSGHKKQPSGSITPGTRRKLFEHSIQKSTSLTYQSESDVSSKQSSKPTTPRLSFKFNKDKTHDPSKGFDFGKSKFVSKHEVVKLGKDVDVRLDSLKLGKEDQLRVVVTPPSRSRAPEDTSVPDLPHRLKKSGKTYEITFRPVEVGTHKVLAFINDQPHPQAPFPIRVYDSSQIIVGDIVPESIVGDSVEFTVDAGRAGFGNLELAIKNSNGIIIPSHVSQLETGTAKFLVTFNPSSLGVHSVNITFNKETIKGSPFEVRVVDTPALHADGMATTESKKKDKLKDKKSKKAERNGSFKNQPIVSKLPSLSRIGKPAVILLQIPNETDAIIATVTGKNFKYSSKQNLPAEIFEDGEGVRRIEFLPQRVGDHEIYVNVNSVDVSGSPFTCRVYDPAQIKVEQIPDGVVNKPVHFTVDASEAGVGNLEVAVNDGKIPSMAQALGQHRYEISFVPRKNFDHTISVRFNNEAVPGSPFLCRLLSALQVSASGAGLERVAVGRAVDFTIDLNQPKGQVQDAPMPQVIVTDSKGHRLPVSVSRDIRSTNSGHFVAEYTPKVVGNHHVEVLIDGEPIHGSPFNVKAFDASCARLSLTERAVVHRPCNFIIDASKSGAGNMEIIVSVDDRNVPNFVQAEGQARFKVSFTPQEAKPHTISVKFNNEPIPGSPLICAVDSDDHVAAPPLPKSPPPADEEIRLIGDLSVAQVGHPKRFSIDAPQATIDCIVKGPNGRNVTVDLVAVRDGYDVEFVPTVIGDYNIDIQVEGRSLSICPIICQAIAEESNLPLRQSSAEQGNELDLSEVQLVGLSNDVVDVPQKFKVDWSKSGGSTIDVKVSSASGQPVPCKLRQLKHGIHECIFTPTEPGLYLIDVFINNIQLPENPYEVEIRDSNLLRTRGDAVNSAQVGRTSHFEVITGSANVGDLDVLITDPHKSPLPVKCYKQQDKSYWVEFTPEHIGVHLIEVTFADTPVNGSPFHCEVVDPKQIHVRGLEDRQSLRHIAQVTVGHKGAGNGQLEFEIRDPNGAQLKIDRLKNSAEEDRFDFLPTKTGPHAVSLKFAGFPVPGVPKTIRVEEKTQLVLQGPGIDKSGVEVDQPAVFYLDTRQQAGGLKIVATDPQGNKVRHTTNKRPDNKTEITFSPSQLGTYNIAVDFNNKKLAGTPYKVNVVDPKKVLVNDENTSADGSLLLNSNERNVIEIEGMAAGPGNLRAEVRDSRGDLLSENDARVESVGQGNYRLIITPRRSGTYKIFLYFADLPVPSAYPLIAHAAQSHSRTTSPKGGRQEVRHTYTSSHSHTTSFESASTPIEFPRVRVYGEGLNRAVVREPAEFFVDTTNLSRSKITATLTGEKADIPVRLHQVENNLYKAVYTPTLGGPYELHINSDDRPVKDSPYRVHVQSFNSPAEMIDVDARTLKIGILGEDVKTIIDARKATAGHLSAQCEGPNQLEYCEIFDNRDGTYVLRVTPKELGRHVLSIKYSEEHVPGSPFIFNVSNPPDASKVKVYGPGVEHGILATYKSNFVVETRGAGAGQLTVRVRGPKGAFNVEMQRDRNQDRTIHCKYEPREPGDYQIEVRWHGVHVPGSPFTVLIVDTEQELQRFLSGGVPSPPPSTPFVPPGWVGAAPGPIAPHQIAPPLAGPPLAPSLYGPIPVNMIQPSNVKVRRSGGQPVHVQPIYGRGPRPRY